MKKGIISILVLLCLFISSSFPVIAEPQDDTADDAPAVHAISYENKMQGYKKVAETKELILYYNYDDSSIKIEDRRTGFIWTSSVDEDYYNDKITPVLSNSMNSLFIFNVTDFAKDYSQCNVMDQENREVNVTEIENGLAVNFYFPTYEVGWTVRIWLEDDALRLLIPAESIREDGKYGLITLTLLPFFGASKNYEDGYIFYPDGSGALLHFKGRDHAVPRQYRFDIYGEDRVDFEVFEENEILGQQTAMLPVFGLKRGENAFLGIVDEGEHDAYINLSLSGFMASVNRIATIFRYRRDFVYTTSDYQEIEVMDKKIVLTDRGVQYKFLVDEDANYSGMANAYREYLTKTNGIRKIIREGDSIPLKLDLFMGIKERRLLFDKYIVMTTFRQSETILSAFLDKGVDNMFVNLLGWTKRGYGAYPTQLPAHRKLGGARGLRKLAEFAEENKIRLLLQDNFTDANGKNKGFSKRMDVVHSPANAAITDFDREEFLLNPLRAYNRFTAAYLPKVAKYGADGITFENFGRQIYYDSNKYGPVNRGDTAEYWKKFMEESKNTLGYAASDGGNAYVLPIADQLYNIPMGGSNYLFTDETIPFYQMVVHGMIPYSSGAGNLFYDFDMQKLKWVEYGCLPYFKLTHENSNLLKYTDYNELFSSQYEDWVDVAADIYKEFNERLGDVWSQTMTEHKKLNDNLYRITYENGARVYVNYGEETAEADGYEIDSLNYLVVDEGGNVR